MVGEAIFKCNWNGDNRALFLLSAMKSRASLHRCKPQKEIEMVPFIDTEPADRKSIELHILRLLCTKFFCRIAIVLSQTEIS